MSAEPAKLNVAPESQSDLVITRLFDAPPELVFQAWTDPVHLAEWWGPKGFTNPVCEIDVRVGGAIRIHMRAPNGVVYPMTGVFKEISEPNRLVFVSSPLDDQGKAMFDVLTTVLFVEQKGKTLLTMRAQVLRTTTAAAPHLAEMEAGWTSALDRLGDHLASQKKQEETLHVAEGGGDSTADREITSTRVFDAPRPLVWKMWTDAEHVVEWWGPKGFSTTIQEMDVRPGGTWRLVMHGPDGRDYKNRIIYREVVEPEKLVYEHSPEPGSEPVNFQTTVTFADHGDRTQVAVRMRFRTSAQRDFVAEKYGAVEGLEQTLGRLEGKLRNRSSARSNEPSLARELLWLVDMSLDGFMSGPNGELDWASASMDDEIWSDVRALLERVDAALFGRVTYHLFERYWPAVPANPASPKSDLEFARWIEATPKHVASKTLPGLAWKNSFLLDQDLLSAIGKLKGQPGKNLLLFGSGNLASRLLAANLIDEVHLRFHPVILGRGRPLFEDAMKPFRWTTLASKQLRSGVIRVIYRR
jgi:uncharacterized protein YndB with AHSA1/START domain/dihydrofolate reductase